MEEGDTVHRNQIGVIKMRRSRQRKKIVGSWISTQGRQGGGAWSVGASPRPSYESFRIPTSRGVSSEAIQNKDKNVTGRIMTASNAENVQDSATYVTLLQHVLLAQYPSGRDDCAFASQAALSPISVNALDWGGSTARPLQQVPGIGVKHSVVKLSSYKTPEITSRELSHEPGRETVGEAESQNEAQTVVWSNAAFCPENPRCDQSNYGTHPRCNISIPSHYQAMSTAQVRYMNQSQQVCCERGAESCNVETQKEEIPSGLAVCGGISGAHVGGLPSIHESCCDIPESRIGQVRNGCGYDLAAGSITFNPLVSNISMSSAAAASKSSPATASMSCPAMSGCSGLAGTAFNASCSFHTTGGGCRAVPAPTFSTSVGCNCAGPPVSRQDILDPERARLRGTSPHRIGQDEEFNNQLSQGGNVGVPALKTDGSHTPDLDTSPGDGSLVCPGPWMHKGLSTSDTVATSIVNRHANQLLGTNSQVDMKSACIEKLVNYYQHGFPEPALPPDRYALLNDYNSNTEADIESEMQRQLEEEIAREISILSQKLENLQARYGARRAFQKNAKNAVLSCPQTPLLLDTPRLPHRDGKEDHNAVHTSHGIFSESASQARPAKSPSFTITHPHIQERSAPMCHLEDRKLIGSNNCSKNRGLSHCPRKRHDTGTAAASKANQKYSYCKAALDTRLPARSATRAGTRTAHGFFQGGDDLTRLRVVEESVRVETPISYGCNSATSYQLGPENSTCKLGDDIPHQTDLKEQLSTSGLSIRDYPDSQKRFDWVKDLRFGGFGAHNSTGSCVAYPILKSCSHSHESECAGADCGSLNSKVLDAARDAETRVSDIGDHADPAIDMDIPPGGLKTAMSKYVEAGGTSPQLCRLSSLNGTVLTLGSRDGHNDGGGRTKRRLDTSLEHRPGKSGETYATPDNVDGFDSRLTLHLLKAGLKRLPSCSKTPDSRSIPSKLRKPFGARDSRKDGGKRLRRRCHTEPLRRDFFAKNLPEMNIRNVIRESEAHFPRIKESEKSEETIEVERQREAGDYEAEYETFIETRGHVECEGHTRTSIKESLASASQSEEDESCHQCSPSSISTQEKARLSEAAVVSLTKNTQATKKTYIRCIELVGAIRNKEAVSKFTETPGIGHSSGRNNCMEGSLFHKMESHHDSHDVGEGHDCQVATDIVAGEQRAKKSKGPPETCGCKAVGNIQLLPTSMKLRQGLQKKCSGTASGSVLRDEDLTQNRAGNGLMEDIAKTCPHKIAVTFLTTTTWTRAGATAAHPFTSTCPFLATTAEGQDLSGLVSILSRVILNRSRWESLKADEQLILAKLIIDALENEQLALPKIKTQLSPPEPIEHPSISPRASGCVKRVAEQVKTKILLDRAPLPSACPSSSSSVKQIQKPKLRNPLNPNMIHRGRHWCKVHHKQALVF